MSQLTYPRDTKASDAEAAAYRAEMSQMWMDPRKNQGPLIATTIEDYRALAKRKMKQGWKPVNASYRP